MTVVFLDVDGVLVPFQQPSGRDNLIWSANLGTRPRPEKFTAGAYLFLMKRSPNRQ